MTGVTGQAEVTDLEAPSLTRKESIVISSPEGNALSEQRQINVENHPNSLSSQHAFANITTRASASYGFLRAAVTADAGYDQSAYVPGPNGELSLVAPVTLPLRPTTLAQATARCKDEITVTSATVAQGDTVPFVFRIELGSTRNAIYQSADGKDGTYNDSSSALSSYSGRTLSSGDVSGFYTSSGVFVNADAILTLRVSDAAAPDTVLWTKTLRMADGSGLFFTDFSGEVTANLVVGKTYIVEGDLQATARSDGGSAYVAVDWSPDPTRKDNRSVLYGIDATKSGGRILITPASSDGDFTAKSGALYDGVEDVPASAPTAQAPAVKIAGKKKVVTSRKSVVVRGSTTGAVTLVTAQVGAKAPFRPVEGDAAWKFTAKLKPGRNAVTVIARGPGGTSTPARVQILRK